MTLIKGAMSRTFVASILVNGFARRSATTPRSHAYRRLPGVRFVTGGISAGGGGSDTPKDWPILANAVYEMEIPLPEIKKRSEDLETTRARLLYQSRKRGMAENDILISTFAKAYLPGFDAKELSMYDDIINKPSNDWDLYYWMTGASPIPNEFDNDVMALMVEHAKNTRMEVRISQPPLEPGKMMLGYDAEEENQ